MATGFSYAQAAKGISSTSTPIGQSNKIASGADTPSKELGASAGALPTLPLGLDWADGGDGTSTSHHKTRKELDPSSPIHEAPASGFAPHSRKGAGSQQNQISGLASPEFGTASSSTLGKDDDSSSIVNASSESTWEIKSQASTSVERLTDSGDVSQEYSSKIQPKEQNVQKPLYEAPLPTVNIWKQRAEDARKSKPSAQLTKQPTSASSSTIVSSMKPQIEQDGAPGTDPRKKVKQFDGAEKLDQASSGKKDRRQSASVISRSQDDERNGRAPRESRSTRAPQKDESFTMTAPPPPAKDEVSWPTPETAQDEDRKKTVPKVEKDEKDRQPGSATKSHGKNEWTKMAYTPNVIFNTPLPNGSSRRGGRGGNRGTSQAASRGGSHTGTANDRDSLAQVISPPSDIAKPDRLDIGNARNASPEKLRRAGSIGPTQFREKAAGLLPERIGRSNGVDTQSYQKSGTEDAASPVNGQVIGSFPKHATANRHRQTKKYEAGHGERPKDGLSNRNSGENIPTGRLSRSAEGDERKALPTDGSIASNKHTSADRRNGHFDAFPTRQRGEGRGRGSVRGSRGGHHTFSTTYHSSGGHVFANENVHAIGANSVTAPRSPTISPEQASAYFGPLPQQLRSFRGAGSRTQSITVDATYGNARTPNGYQTSLPPVQTFGYSSYEHAMMPQPPQSAMPYTPYIDQYQLISMIQMQIEYYFSVENLCKDMFLRKNMDSQGFVFLSKIAEFNRIKQLTIDMDLLKLVCYDSTIIEYRLGSDGKDRLRRRDGWQHWVLPEVDREDVAKNDGPDELHHPPVPHAKGFEAFHHSQQSQRYPPSAPVTGPTSPKPHANGFPHQLKEGVSGDTQNGAPTKSIPSTDNTLDYVFQDAVPSASRPAMNPEADSFSDDQVEGLRVIVRHLEPGQAPAPFHSASSRTFSNGSINSRNICEELHSTEPFSQSGQPNTRASEYGREDRTASGEVQRFLSPTTTDSHATNSLKVFWVKDKDKPVDSLPPESIWEFYTHLHSKALQQRQLADIGFCPYDMDVLYQFWSHFLIRNFNTRMYDEFRCLAFDDNNQRMTDSGVKNLIKYYGEALSSQSTIRLRVARHYVEVVNMEQPSGEQLAFKQLRSAWRNGALNLKNRKRLNEFVEPALRTALEA